jgi:hypothetical protein
MATELTVQPELGTKNGAKWRDTRHGEVPGPLSQHSPSAQGWLALRRLYKELKQNMLHATVAPVARPKQARR